MQIESILGQRIKELRGALKLSQEALADKAEVDRTFINHVENGRRNISIRSLERIVHALDVSFTQFFNDPRFN